MCCLICIARLKKTRDDFLKVLGNSLIAPRLWMPYQVGDEFLRNREQEIANQIESNFTLRKLAETARDTIKKTIKQKSDDFRWRHIEQSDLVQQIDKAFEEIFAAVSKQPAYDISVDSDPILSAVETLYSGKIGADFTETEYHLLFTEGEFRHREKMPPGYEDADKPLLKNKFGDLIVW